MATIYISEPSKTERFSEKTDHSLIEAVQERSILLKTGTDERNPAIRLGNRAFSELIKRYNNWIWKQVNAFTGLGHNEAYSAALQGFEKAIAKFDLSQGYALASFASVVVHHAIQKVLHKEQRQIEKVKLAAAIAPLYHEDEFVDPYEQEQREQQIKSLNSEIENLEPSGQKIVELRNAGMKFRQIGEFFGKTADAVRMIFNRAIALLKKQLQPQTALQTAEVDESMAIEPAVIPEGWMGRLRSLFSKGVRFLKSRAISNSSIIPSSNSHGRLDLSVKLPKLPDSTLDSSSTRSSPCSSLLIDERMFCPGSQVSDLATGRTSP
jgi:RNA polymerase sigma factor (sigma-70 family)